MVPFVGTLHISCRIIIGIQKRDHNVDNHPHRDCMRCYNGTYHLGLRLRDTEGSLGSLLRVRVPFGGRDGFEV